MTSNLIISLRSASKRSTIAALTCSVEALHRHYHIKHSHFSTTEGGGQIHNSPKSVAAASLLRRPIEWLTGGFEVLCRRSFHGGGSAANFRASSPSSQAVNAVADFSDEDRASSLPGTVGARNDDGLEISNLGISEQIVSALAKKGITKLFPIQKAVLEPAMQGRDMIGRARTGTGKTLAFGIPIMDKIIRFNEKHGLGRNPLALILAPTRELARQVEKEFYESAPNLVSLCVYGGSPIFNQISHLDKGADVVVGTPGRVIDLIKRGALNLSEVQFLVLDEADQMLNVGFQEAVESILENLPKNRQSLMFSATMPNWIRKLTENYLKDPLTIDLVGNSDQKLADGITLYAIASEMFEKSAIIGPLVTEHAKGGKCIVFTQTKRDADRLAYGLQKEFKCEALHGDIAQNQRERTLSGFRDGRFNVLVATDVAARGLDVPNVDLVIHYELPSTSEIFVHRSGRTGRAGKKGSAILVYSSNQMRDVKTIERDVGCKFVELPRISVEAGASNMFRDMGPGRFTSFGGGGGSRFGNSGFAHSGSGQSAGYGNQPSGSRFGNSGFAHSGSGRSAGYGNQPSGRMGSFGESGSSRPGFGGSGSGPSGTGRLGGGLGGFNSSRPGNFSGHASGRSGGFGDMGSSDRSSGIGAGNSGRFGDLRSSQTSGDFSDSRSRYSGGLGDDNKIGGEQNTGWKAF